MSKQSTFNFDDGQSGGIWFNNLIGYLVSTGWASCSTGYDESEAREDYRGYFSFNTSSLPDDCTVTLVEFKVIRGTTEPSGAPETYRLKWSVGTFIGRDLNGNVGEWQGGTWVRTDLSKPANFTWIDLGSGAPALISLTGDTDVKAWDDSTEGDGDNYWGIAFNTSKSKCQLRVTYGWNWATATGRGHSSAAGGAIRSGSATATGSGDSSAVGAAIRSGSATATGSGNSSAAGQAIRSGSATATGSGDGSALGRATRSGSATATGSGNSAAAGGAIRSGSATATSSGDSSAAGRAIRSASAAATGSGSASATGVVVRSASASATGSGDSSAAGAVIRSASAAVTGYGYSSGVLTQHSLPLAMHCASRSVSAVDLNTRSISQIHSAALCVAAVNETSRSVQAVDTASCAVAPADAETRGPRRNLACQN